MTNLEWDWQTNGTPEVRTMELAPICVAHSSKIAAQIVNDHNREKRLEEALQSIANLWPDPDCCAELVPEWVGPNDGRMRADTLWYALNGARKALGLPEYPKPEHWSKKKTEREEEA